MSGTAGGSNDSDIYGTYCPLSQLSSRQIPPRFGRFDQASICRLLAARGPGCPPAPNSGVLGVFTRAFSLNIVRLQECLASRCKPPPPVGSRNLATVAIATSSGCGSRISNIPWRANILKLWPTEQSFLSGYGCGKSNADIRRCFFRALLLTVPTAHLLTFFVLRPDDDGFLR